MSDLIYRPGGARVVAYAVAVILVLVTVVIGVSLPPEITFTVAELITLALVLLGALALLHGVGRSRVIADDRGLRIRNGFRDHQVAWSDIEGFSMTNGAPWPTLVTTDDDRVILFAIQGTDGPRAGAAVEDLRQRLAQHR